MEDVSYKYTCMILIFTCIFFLNNLKKKKYLFGCLQSSMQGAVCRLLGCGIGLSGCGSQAPERRLSG